MHFGIQQPKQLYFPKQKTTSVDQAAWMCSLICTFVVCTCSLQVFSRQDSNIKVGTYTGPDKSNAQLPRTSPNFGWANDFLFNLPRKMYRIYREYCNSEPFSRCCEMPGKWLKLGLVRPCIHVVTGHSFLRLSYRVKIQLR